MQEFDMDGIEDNAATTGMKWLGRILAIVTILVVAAFGDVMYIQLMSGKFPSGPLLIMCYIGAFTSFLAMIYMLIGKSMLFTPGRQMTFAWLVFALELALIGLNIILVFQGGGSGSTGFLAFWDQLAPATPVINMASVALLYFLDEDGKMHHEDVEMAYDLKRAQRRHVKAMARARLRLQHKQLNFLVTELDRAVSSPESLLTIEATARDLNTDLLGQLSGHRYANRALPAPASAPALAAPALQSIPVSAPVSTALSPEESARLNAASVSSGSRVGNLMAKAKGFLGLGGSSEQEAVTLSQTGTAAAAPAPAQRTPASHAPASSRAAALRARRHARLRGAATVHNYQATATAQAARKQAAPAPAAVLASAPAPAPIEHRTCSECPTVFVVKNAKQLTCSPACRSKRSRRLAALRKGGQGA